MGSAPGIMSAGLVLRQGRAGAAVPGPSTASAGDLQRSGGEQLGRTSRRTQVGRTEALHTGPGKAVWKSVSGCVGDQMAVGPSASREVSPGGLTSGEEEMSDLRVS